MSRHGFADDGQLYNRLSMCDEGTRTLQVQVMQQCVAEVRHWMISSKLKLNDSKTEVMIISSKYHIEHLSNITLKIGEEIIIPKSAARNLGATIDSTLTMDHQVNAMTRSMYHHIRRISKVKHCLTTEACAKATITTVTSHLDYHNGLLLGASDKLLHKLQVAQNSAARLLTGTSRREHITPILRQLHWLPVKQRIYHKVLTIIHKSLHCSYCPEYMQDLFLVYQPARNPAHH